MGIIIAGMVVVAMLLAASGVMFSTFLDTSVSGGQSLKKLTQDNIQRVGSALKIISLTFEQGGNTDLTGELDNTGSQSVFRFGEMDVVVKYTDSDDKSVLTHLLYVESGIGNNQWTLASTGVTPDSFNPNAWDSDESLFVDLRVDPAVKSGTAAVVVVGTPWAVSDQTSVNAP